MKLNIFKRIKQLEKKVKELNDNIDNLLRADDPNGALIAQQQDEIEALKRKVYSSQQCDGILHNSAIYEDKPIITCDNPRDLTKTFRKEYHLLRYDCRAYDSAKKTFLKELIEQNSLVDMVQVAELDKPKKHPDERIILAELTVTKY